MLQNAALDRRIHTSAERILGLLKSNCRTDILEQLIVRQIIETESAGLAAVCASQRVIAKLLQIVQEAKKIRSPRESSGVEEDVDFHVSLAKASGNRVIFSLVRLLRAQEWINFAVIAIRAKVGTDFVVDHEEIIAALRDRNPVRGKDGHATAPSENDRRGRRVLGRAFHRTSRLSRPSIESNDSPSHKFLHFRVSGSSLRIGPAFKVKKEIEL